MSCLCQDALPIKTLQRYGFFRNYQTFSRIFFEKYFSQALAYLIIYAILKKSKSLQLSARLFRENKKTKYLCTLL
jgi:hypothetical protein